MRKHKMQTILLHCNRKLNYILLIFRFNAGLAIGELVGPIVGGYVAKFVTYPRAFSILGLIMLGFNVFYFPLNFMKFDKKEKSELKL